MEQSDETLLAHFERLDSTRIKGRRVHAEFAKHARIDKTQLAAGGECCDQVRVLGYVGAGLADQHASRHAEVHDPLRRFSARSRFLAIRGVALREAGAGRPRNRRRGADATTL